MRRSTLPVFDLIALTAVIALMSLNRFSAFSVMCLTPALLNAAPPLSSHASQERARLAVLELQGDYASITERQHDSDRARQRALKALASTGVKVLDREEFEVLMPPQVSLSECVGRCSVEVARLLGAHWVLSARGDLSQGELLMSFKLHSASGELLSVAQERLSSAQLSAQARAALIERLTSRALEPLHPTAHSSTLTSPTKLNAVDHAIDESSSPASPTPHEPITPELSWYEQETPEGARCLSGLIPHALYLRCVEAGACDPSLSAGSCQVAAHEPVKCVSFNDALRFSAWLMRAQRRESAQPQGVGGERLLPTPHELSLTPPLPLEVWVLREGQAPSPLQRRALKVAPKELIASRRGTRPTPPAFKAAHIGLSVSLPVSCAQLTPP